jgi:hypothetical protein
MREIFKDVPAIYGFSSVAPLGPMAASFLNRNFQSAGTGDVGTGRASSRLLASFAGHNLTVVSGLGSASEPLAAHRRDVCEFSDDRLVPAQRVARIHQILGREMADVRMLLDRIERQMAALSDAQRQEPAIAQALEEIQRDASARTRFIEFARDADQLPVRARMFALARSFGWLTPEEHRAEILRMVNERIAQNAVGSAEVDLVCALNADRWLDPLLERIPVSAAQADKVSVAAVQACLGSSGARERVLRALTSRDDDEVRIAQVYLTRQPIEDAQELRDLANRVAAMRGARTQVRALETLARLRLNDREALDALARLYPVAESASVQTAIATVLVHADYSAIASPELVQTLRTHRLKSDPGENMIDVLIRRLQVRN